MENAMAELPLALFTTLAPLGAGAFIALAVALGSTKFSDAQLKALDKMSFIPFVVAVVGFALSALHLANPAHAFGVFSHVGSSPLSNEILVGTLFLLVALVYLILACTNKLQAGARKVFAYIVAIMAVVFAIFTGLAYMIKTIPSWNVAALPLSMIGYALLGAASLGVLVLVLAQVLNEQTMLLLKRPFKWLALVGVVLAAGGLLVQVLQVNGMSNYVVVGSELVAEALPFIIAALICLILSAIVSLKAFTKIPPVSMMVAATVLACAGIFFARLVFYALRLSVGLML